MSKEFRKEIRYGLTDFKIKGEIILYPDPSAITVTLKDISPTGAGVEIISKIDDPTEEEISLLVNAWKKGSKIPVQFSFNNTKIPTHIVSMIGNNKCGLLISDNEKLAALADKGRKLFNKVIIGVIKRSVGEKGSHESDFFPEDAIPRHVAEFLDKAVASGMVQRALLTEALVQPPALGGKVADDEDVGKIERLFQNFFNDKGRDVLLLLGHILLFLEKQSPAASLETLLPFAVGKIFDENALFADVLKRLEAELSDNFLKKRMPASFAELNPGHPVAEIVRSRFEAYAGRTFYLAKMAPSVYDFYVNSYSTPDSDVVWLAREMEETQSRKIGVAWVQNELNAVASGKIRDGGKIIDGLFRQAMYEHVTRSKAKGVSFEAIADIVDSKLPAGFKDISERFLRGVCDLIDDDMRGKFARYMEETDEDRKSAKSRMEGEARLRALPAVELMKRFCWPSIVEAGEMNQLQREAARSWIPKDSLADYMELGGVVVIPRQAYDDFISNAGNESLMGETPTDFFQEVDLLKHYNETVAMPNGTKRKGPFGMYIDTLYPLWVRERILDLIINSPQWSRYYVLGKTRRYFQRFFGGQSEDFIKFIEENMLSSAYAKAEYI